MTDLIVIIIFGLMSLARSKAVSQMVFKTYLEFSCFNILLRKVIVTCSQRIDIGKEIEDGPNGSNRGIRTEIFRAIFNAFAGKKDPWKTFVLDAYERVGLPVFKVDIVLRVMGLDQGVFKNQSIMFCGNYGVLYLLSLLD